MSKCFRRPVMIVGAVAKFTLMNSLKYTLQYAKVFHAFK